MGLGRTGVPFGDRSTDFNFTFPRSFKTSPRLGALDEGLLLTLSTDSTSLSEGAFNLSLFFSICSFKLIFFSIDCAGGGGGGGGGPPLKDGGGGGAGGGGGGGAPNGGGGPKGVGGGAIVAVALDLACRSCNIMSIAIWLLSVPSSDSRLEILAIASGSCETDEPTIEPPI